MQTAVMDEILRQRDMELKEAVRAGLAGEVRTAFEKLGDGIVQVEREDIGAEAADRWLSLSVEDRAAAGVIAPIRALRDEINTRIRENLIAEGAVSGPVRQGEKLVSRGLTRAEMARASNYSAGDTVIFNRRYKTLGVEKGDEREVARVDYDRNTVWLDGGGGDPVAWRPYQIAAAKDGVEVYRSEEMELRAGDRVRWTRNDPGSELVNGETAEVESIEKEGVRFWLENGKAAGLDEDDPQLRHMDRAWAATVHSFQGRTVDRIVAAMPAGNPNLTNQRAFYVAISRARDHAELVTDDARNLRIHPVFFVLQSGYSRLQSTYGNPDLAMADGGRSGRRSGRMQGLRGCVAAGQHEHTGIGGRQGCTAHNTPTCSLPTVPRPKPERAVSYFLRRGTRPVGNSTDFGRRLSVGFRRALAGTLPGQPCGFLAGVRETGGTRRCPPRDTRCDTLSTVAAGGGADVPDIPEVVSEQSGAAMPRQHARTLLSESRCRISLRATRASPKRSDAW